MIHSTLAVCPDCGSTDLHVTVGWPCRDNPTHRADARVMGRGPRPRPSLRVLAAVLVAAVLAGACAPPAQAMNPATPIRVRLGWVGPDCLPVQQPSVSWNRSRLESVRLCDPNQRFTVTYVTRPGQWYGIDPVDVPGVAVSCAVDRAGRVVMQSSGFTGVACLGRL